MKKNTTQTTKAERILTHEEMMEARRQGWMQAQDGIKEIVERAHAAFVKAQEDFTARFTVNPADAISWSAQTVVEKQTAYVETLNLSQALLDKATSVNSALELLAQWRAEKSDKLLRNFSIGRSTCPWSNAVENAKTLATRETIVGWNGAFGEFKSLLSFTDKNCEKMYAQALAAAEAAA